MRSLWKCVLAAVVLGWAVPALAVPLVSPPSPKAWETVAQKKAPPPEDAQDDDDEEEDETGVWGMVHKVNGFYPIILDKHLEPEVKKKVIPMWITTVFCGAFCGPLWIPMLWVGENPGMEYFLKEALIAIAVEMFTWMLGGATSGFAGLGMILIMADLLYFAPVSLIDGYDRALKRQRAKEANGDDEEDDPKPKLKRRTKKPKRKV